VEVWTCWLSINIRMFTHEVATTAEEDMIQTV